MSKPSTTRRGRINKGIVGLLMMLIAVLAFFYTTETNMVIILLLTFGLLITGIMRIGSSLSKEELTNLKVISRFLSGLIAIVISVIVIIMILFTPDLALDLWFFFLAVSLLIIGLARIILGIRTEGLVNWFRIYLVFVGVITIILSVLIFTTPVVGELYIVILVAVGLLINGSARLIRGVLGK